MKDEAPIPYEGHLDLALKRMRRDDYQWSVRTQFERETGQSLSEKGATAAGDRWRLRGIPVVGRTGAPGGVDGRRLPQASINRLDPLSRKLAQLGSIDGTSPGSQPEEALLAKEAEEEAEFAQRVFEPERMVTDLLP